jgi:hypothetical protein
MVASNPQTKEMTMGWSQEDSYEGVQQFLARLCGVDLEKVVNKAVADGMEKKGLTLVKVEDVELGFEDNFLDMGSGTGKRVTLSDGSVFVHRVVRSVMSDDWGSDYFELRSPDEVIKVEKTNLLDEDEEYNPEDG